MGEIADDMIDGTSCALCGQYYEKNGESYTHGYPATCNDCWDDLTPSEKKLHQKQEEDVSTF